MNLFIDLETYSSVDLLKSGVYPYAQAPDFEILLLAYAWNDEPVQVIDLASGEHIPYLLTEALLNPEVTKLAHNANFERTCLSAYLGVHLQPEGWHCTTVHASSLGLPRSLADVGSALGLSEEKQKMKEGKALIQYFCKPCKPTKSNGGRTRNLPSHAPDKWNTFVEYNRRDVETEREIYNVLKAYPIIDQEVKAYCLDQRINDRGVLVDAELADGAVKISEDHNAALRAEAERLTNLTNVNSVAQLKEWLGTEGPLDKKAVKALRDSGALTPDQDRLLAIRQEMGKSSVAKYDAMLRGMCADHRVRGLYQFYGAGRTGRWAGRQVQMQNLPQNHMADLDTARDLVRQGDAEALAMIYPNVPQVLSELIRTTFIAKPGHTFVVCDYSAVEARALAYLSQEQWRMDTFAKGGDIYCASASQMFGVPVEKHGVNGHLRQKGKIAELALGYGGSVGALTAMGALDMGLKEEELKPLVDMWREASPNVVQFWWDVDKAARSAINGIPEYVGNIRFERSRKLLHITLPSGRAIRYWEPLIEENADGRENITYMGQSMAGWARQETYGPKIVENICQGFCRDLLARSMMMVEELGYDIVGHVHDEMIVEVPKEKAEEALQQVQAIMAEPVPWAKGLLLRGDGYITDYYKKD